MFTSLKLSKLLAANGCELESEMYWQPKMTGVRPTTCAENECTRNDNHWHQPNAYGEDMGLVHLPDTIVLSGFRAYDILNDLCTKYAKEVWGERTICGNCIVAPERPAAFCLVHAESTRKVLRTKGSWVILELLQQGKQEEAEQYLWEHTILNPKNK
jgi:hypothetical protein